MSKVYDFRENITREEFKDIINTIKNGGTVVFPTETVYGIGANALDEEAVSRIFLAKGRPSDNPLIVHISDIGMLERIVGTVKNIEKKLIDAFWPGPLTIIFKKNIELPKNVTAGLDTVGIRMPNNKIALDIIRESGLPIAGPSANISGKPSGTKIEDIFKELDNKVDIMINAGATDIGVESTVVKIENDTVIILRPGRISKEDIELLGIKAEYDSHLFKEADKDEIVASPGMKHKHYAPNTKAILIKYDEDTKMIDKILDFRNKNKDKKISALCFEEHRDRLEKMGIMCISNGKKEDLLEISKNIFTNLRKIDYLGADLCIIEGVKDLGIGTAIMNRLIRACEYNLL